MTTSGLTFQRQIVRALSIGHRATWSAWLVLVSVIVLYWPSFAWLAVEWSALSGVFGHGFPVACLSVILIFRATRSLDAGTLSPEWVALPVLLALSVVWLLGFVANVLLVQTTVLPLIMLASIWVALGRRAAMTLSFSVLFLYFAMPAWSHVQFVFQNITTVIVHILIRIVDIPVYVEGNFVYVPSGTFEIAGGCSGIGFILVATSLATLFGYVYNLALWTRLQLIGSALLIAMVINWVRVFVIVLVGNKAGMQHPFVTDHLAFGWVLFCIVLLPALYLINRSHPVPETVPKTVSIDVSRNVIPDNRSTWGALAAVVLALSAAPAWAHALRAGSVAQAPPGISLPAISGHWSGPFAARAEWFPRFFGASAEAIGEYRASNHSVWMYANVYQEQSQDRELIYHRNSALGDLRQDRRRDRNVGHGGILAEEVEADGARQRWLIWYWYDIGGWQTTGESRAKLLQALAILVGRPMSGAIAVGTTCGHDCVDASRRLEEFMALVKDQLQIKRMVTTENHQ